MIKGALLTLAIAVTILGTAGIQTNTANAQTVKSHNTTVTIKPYTFGEGG